MNTKLHAVSDESGRPISLFVAAARGYGADWFRDAFGGQGHHALNSQSETPDRACPLRQAPLQKPNPLESMSGRSKDWRRVATGYDRCPAVFLSAIALAATVLFWL